MVGWWEDWHGSARIPAAAVSGLSTAAGGGSTAMSTGTAQALSTKASIGHTHAQADVAGLTSTIASLTAAISTKAPGSHAHPIDDVTNLQAALDLKAASTHTHPPIAGGVIPSTWVVASTHVLTGSTAMQSVTGLSFAVSSAATYRFEFIVGVVSSVLTCGAALGLNGPANPLLVTYEWMVSTGLAGGLVRTNRAFGAQTVPSAAVDSTAAVQYGYLGGICRTGATAGTLQLQFASEVAGSTVSVRGGSVGFLFGPL